MKVITPAGLALEEQVETVVLKGEMGEFGVLAGHVPMVSTLVAGTMRYESAKGEEKTFIIHRGVSEVREDTVTVLTKALESPGDMSVSEAAKEAEEIEQSLEDGSLSDEEHKRLSGRLMLVRARAGM